MSMYDYPELIELKFRTDDLIRNTREAMSRTFVPMVVFDRDKTKTSLVKAKNALERMGL